MNDFQSFRKSIDSLKQLVRYTIVGISSNLIGYLIYFLITHHGGTPKITMTILYSAGAVIGYFGNRTFTFSHRGSVFSSVARYFMAHFLGYLINVAILIFFVDQLGFNHQYVQAFAIFFVAGILFIAHKFFVFRNSDSLTSGGL